MSYSKGAFHSSFILIMLFALILPIHGTQVSTDSYSKTGPFLDSVELFVIESYDQQVLALQNNEIDVTSYLMHPSYFNQGGELENVQVYSTLRNGYGYLTINTAKFPFNYTALRRAMALAIDKNQICNSWFDGLAIPIDSIVPRCNPWSIEASGDLDYDYYDPDPDTGKQLLDDAGFIDVDSDGFREAPDGSDFDILVEVATTGVAAEIGQIVEQALLSLELDADYATTDFYEYLNRLYFHGDYDVIFLGDNFEDFDVDWLAYYFWGSFCPCCGDFDTEFPNFPNWRNYEYDSWRGQLLHSLDYQEVYEAAIEMQRVFIEECPIIPLYEDIYLTACRIDRFEGMIGDSMFGYGSRWFDYNTRLTLSEGGPFGGNLRRAIPEYPNSFNFMLWDKDVYRPYLCPTVSDVWDSLLIRDPSGQYIPWLAETHSIETHSDNPSIQAGHTRITFSIARNASFSDGSPLNAEDVAFSLNFYRDGIGNPYGVDLEMLSAAYAPNDNTLIVEFESESYWHLNSIASKPVIPKHVFADIGIENWSTWNPDLIIDWIVSSGPFEIWDYVPDEYVKLGRNPNYFKTPNPSDFSTTNATSTPPPTSNLSVLAEVGITSASSVIIVGVSLLYLRDQRELELTQTQRY